MGKRNREGSTDEVQIETMEERAARFYEEQPAYEGSILVTSNNDVFLDDIKGQNALDNHLSANKEVTYQTVNK